MAGIVAWVGAGLILAGTKGRAADERGSPHDETEKSGWPVHCRSDIGAVRG
jgi:hypothetical protein